MNARYADIPRCPHGGEACPHEDGFTQPCAPGAGLCPRNDDCAGQWSTCSASCTRAWITTTPQSGNGQPCPLESPACAAGEDLCPPNFDCEGGWNMSRPKSFATLGKRGKTCGARIPLEMGFG